MQQWFNLSDPAAEDALYDSESMRRFAGIELAEDAVPDESTILRFRHLLEQHRLTERVFCNPESIHASCEDYRAAADIDLEMDAADELAGRKVECPLHVLGGKRGAIGKLWDVIEVWKQHANGVVSGEALDAGHYLAEEEPDQVLEQLLRFFQ
jgi:pimeloyl-ACP methyl ester carboxylesterase